MIKRRETILSGLIRKSLNLVTLYQSPKVVGPAGRDHIPTQPLMVLSFPSGLRKEEWNRLSSPLKKSDPLGLRELKPGLQVRVTSPCAFRSRTMPSFQDAGAGGGHCALLLSALSWFRLTPSPTHHVLSPAQCPPATAHSFVQKTVLLRERHRDTDRGTVWRVHGPRGRGPTGGKMCRTLWGGRHEGKWRRRQERPHGGRDSRGLNCVPPNQNSYAVVLTPAPRNMTGDGPLKR